MSPLAATPGRAVASLRCAVVDRAPLPPHERPWRHPSELGPPEHEPTTTGGRVLIVTTATLSLLLIGVLAISMTPDRSASPETAASTISGLRTVPATAAGLEQPPLPMVTPLGDDGWAVTTMSAVAGRSGRVQARLPSGEVVDVEIVATDRDAGLTVVSLPVADGGGYQLAATDPAPSDTVLVRTDPPLVVTMVELAALDVDEATPVLDESGDLIGLCTHERDGIALRTVVTMPDDPQATTTVAASQSTAPPTTTATPPTADPSTSTTTTTTTTVPSSAATTTSSAPATTGGVVTSSVPVGRINGGGGATTAPG